MRVCRLAGLLLIALLLTRTALAQSLPGAADRFFLTSDGVRLHYLEAGPEKAHTLIFIPGWTMPAWIWAEQIAAFDRTYHVIAFDPRGQGESAIANSGYEPVRRGQDIADLIAHVGGAPVVLVGWSLGVLDTLAYIHTHGDRAIAGLVLVDNSVGEEPAPRPVRPRRPGRPVPRPVFMENFVRTMFRTPQSSTWLDRLTEAALRTPDWAARELLEYPVPRSYWREAIYSTDKPVLYVVRPGLSGQAGNLERNRPDTESVVFTNAGHALFIDQAARFDALMGSFIRQRVWH
ncbi:MAG: alpha/beta fold hydrolase [Acetobacteraceae bacterium]